MGKDKKPSFEARVFKWIRSHPRWSLALGVLVVIAFIMEATGNLEEPTTPSATESEPTPAPPADTGPSERELIRKAERTVANELPDIPLWQGTTFDGVLISDSEVCVDRTFPPGGGIEGNGGSAGYVIVTFPDGSLGEPQDGTCSTVTASEPAEPVSVPEDLQDEPGLVTRDRLGNDWPLTVPYGVLACEETEAGGMTLQIVTITDPDGTEYALNGTAQAQTDLPAFDPIWADDPDVEGVKIDIGPVIDRGLELCK